jgi:hypothetical protein
VKIFIAEPGDFCEKKGDRVFGYPSIRETVEYQGPTSDEPCTRISVPPRPADSSGKKALLSLSDGEFKVENSIEYIDSIVCVVALEDMSCCIWYVKKLSYVPDTI